MDGLWPGACCLLSRVGRQSGVTLAELAVQIDTPTSSLAPSLDQLTSRALVAIQPGDDANNSPLALTERGQSALERLRTARRNGLAALLAGWSPDRHPELAARLQTMARELIDEDAEKLRDGEGFRTDA